MVALAGARALAVEPSAATEWLSRLPLSGSNPDLADELRWWSHLQRWALSLVARGRWIPQMELSKGEGYPHRARWVPLLNREEDRRRLGGPGRQLAPRGHLCPPGGNRWGDAATG